MLKNLIHSYLYYKSRFLDAVPKKEYLKVNAEFNQFLMSKVLDGHSVRLPSGMGLMYIQGYEVKPKLDEEGRAKNLAPHWGRTRKLWARSPEAKAEKILVFCDNAHSDNIRYRFRWDTNTTKLKNKILYSLKMTRENKRTLSKKIQEGKEYLIS